MVLVAALCAVLPVGDAAIERWYSSALYPFLQGLVTPVTNSLPFALLDLLILAAVVLVTRGGIRAVRAARRTRRAGPLVQAGAQLLAAAAVLYLVFLAIWGLNYRRVSLTEKLAMVHAGPDTNAVVTLAEQAVRELNRLHAPAHTEGWATDLWRDARMRQAFATTETFLTGEMARTHPGRLKATVLGPYFRWASVDGMVNPFGLEVLGNPDLLPWELPFVTAHEWAHLAGYAHEAEASFVGLLACLHGDVPAQYSGWLFVYWQAAGELPPDETARVGGELAPGPRADLDAIVARLQRGQFPWLRRVSWRVYDQYLKANRVDEGVRSYGEVLTLILRARFYDGWVPVRRGSPRDR